MADSNRCHLYLITPPRFDVTHFAPQLERALGAGEVACVQLRLKGTSDDEILAAGDALIRPVQEAGAAFILNDRPDLAVQMGADGVHIGQEDAGYPQARAAMGPDRIVGVTCHNSRHLAIEAAEVGADYVAFGAFFPSPTKTPETHADLETLRWWSEMTVVPCVAIGGITVANAMPLIEAGADFLAVSSGVWNYEAGPAAAVHAFNALF